MTWQFGLLVLIIINTGSIILSKVTSDRLPEKSKGMFWLYLSAACIASLWFVFSGREIGVTGLVFLTIIAIGFINGFANYCHWKALGENMGKTVLFYPLMDVWTIGLTVIFLGEFELWNYQLAVGAILCFTAIWLFQFSSSKEMEKGKTNKVWLFSVIGLVIMTGLTTFLAKAYSSTISRETFLMGFYLGSFVSTLVLLRLERVNPVQKISKKTILLCLVVAGAIFGATGTLYWTFQMEGPVSLVLPVRGLAITLIPLLVGWLVFKERGLSRLGKLGFVMGIAGAVLILLR